MHGSDPVGTAEDMSFKITFYDDHHGRRSTSPREVIKTFQASSNEVDIQSKIDITVNGERFVLIQFAYELPSSVEVTDGDGWVSIESTDDSNNDYLAWLVSQDGDKFLYHLGGGGGKSDDVAFILYNVNHKPDTPSCPTGETAGEVLETYSYSTSTSDPDGDMIRYGWDWDGDGTIDEWTSYYASGEVVNINHSWNRAGEYHVKVKAKDENGEESGFSPALTVIITGNNPPSKPSISGPTTGKPRRSYTYTASTTDPNEDQIYYMFDWGDGTNSGWLGPYDSGSTVSATHKWRDKGNYEIRVKARDVLGAESEWSDPLPVAMPKYQWLTLLPPIMQRILLDILLP